MLLDPTAPPFPDLGWTPICDQTMKTAHYGLALAGGLWLATLASLAAQSYTFTTLAGNPAITNTSGDPVGDYADGANSAARFNFPLAVAVDQAGTVFVADTLNNAIRALRREVSGWVVTTVAGAGPTNSGSADGTNSQAQFSMPQGVAADSRGDLYVADTVNSTIRKITAAGSDWVVTTIAGTADASGTNDGVGSDARFLAPVSVAVDAATNVYVADYTANTIRKLKPVGTNWVVSTIAGACLQTGSEDGTNGQARFRGPGSIVADSAGRVYVSDWDNGTIRMITPVGTNYLVTTIAGKAGITNPIPVDGTGSNARFSSPLGGIGVDSAGTLYVTDAGMVRKVTPVGTNWMVTTIAGAYGQTSWVDGTGSAVRFYWPQAVAADSAGDLYVADSNNHAIRMGLTPSVLSPTLHIALDSGHIILSWPLRTAGLVLQTRTSASAGGTWTSLTNGVRVAGDSFVLTTNLTPQNVFYGLGRP